MAADSMLRRADRAQAGSRRLHDQADFGASASLWRLRRSLSRGIKRHSLGEGGCIQAFQSVNGRLTPTRTKRAKAWFDPSHVGNSKPSFSPNASPSRKGNMEQRLRKRPIKMGIVAQRHLYSRGIKRQSRRRGANSISNWFCIP
jgi:hypothetical protein